MASTETLEVMIQNLSDKLEEIHKEVKYTNGRVRWNEKMIYLALGALVILTPMFGWAVTEILTIDDQIANALDGMEVIIVE